MTTLQSLLDQSSLLSNFRLEERNLVRWQVSNKFRSPTKALNKQNKKGCQSHLTKKKLMKIKGTKITKKRLPRRAANITIGKVNRCLKSIGYLVYMCIHA